MKLLKRKPTRLKGYDYNAAGAYFITICVKGRKELLSKITVGDGEDAGPLRILLYLNSSLHLKGFAIKNTAKIYGKGHITTISSVTKKITKKYGNILMQML